jgi:hypothetical protein
VKAASNRTATTEVAQTYPQGATVEGFLTRSAVACNGRASMPLKTTRRSTGRTLSITALGFVLVFAITAYAGAHIVAFEGLAARVNSLPGEQMHTALPPVSVWRNTDGVAKQARRLALDIVRAETPDDAAAIENAVDEVIKASPTSVAAWQARVVYQQAHDAPTERMLPAFRMSALTGSHEGYYMMQRAIFGLEHWSELAEVDRRTVMRDLRSTALHWDFDLRGGERYRAILGEKSEAERVDIRTALSASGLATEEILQALGL